MCGIIGKAGDGNVIPDIINGLKKLEYRGYDSAGLAVLNGNVYSSVKTAGKVEALAEKVTACRCSPGSTGVGHTRWATHGAPTDKNAHPHFSPDGKFAVVHNGIIENAAELKKTVLPQDEVYASDTDTEVAAHLLAYYYKGDVIGAVSKTVNALQGSFALGILCSDCPDMLFAAAYASPLFATKGKTGAFIASDMGAVGEDAAEIYQLTDREIARLTKDDVAFFSADGKPVVKNMVNVQVGQLSLEKGGYEHYMLYEIMQQPDAVRDTILPLIRDGHIIRYEGFPEGGFVRDRLNRIRIVACGSAYHTGLVAASLIEQYCGIDCRAEVASEFRYSAALIDENTLAVFISQSGETADTLAALRLAKEKGAKTLAIVNTEGSAIATESGAVVFTRAGREIAVATTKAYSAQLAVLYALTLYLAREKGTMTAGQEGAYTAELLRLPEKLRLTLEAMGGTVTELSGLLAQKEDMFFIGRLLDSAAAMEGSLKMKEISYINSQAYAAGELKHGTISLVEEGTPVIALATQPEVFSKTVANLHEVKARGAYTVLITTEQLLGREYAADKVIAVPDTVELFAVSLAVVPLQLLSYHTAKNRGCDIDKPKNLAKSVTVE